MHSPFVRANQRVPDESRRLAVVQPDVVERELKRLACAVKKRRDLPRDVQRRLSAIGEGVNFDQGRLGGSGLNALNDT